MKLGVLMVKVVMRSKVHSYESWLVSCLVRINMSLWCTLKEDPISRKEI